MSRLDLTLAPKTAPVRRVEVITGAGGRRRWTDDEKAQAIEASLAPGAVVSGFGGITERLRKHGPLVKKVAAECSCVANDKIRRECRLVGMAIGTPVVGIRRSSPRSNVGRRPTPAVLPKKPGTPRRADAVRGRQAKLESARLTGRSTRHRAAFARFSKAKAALARLTIR